MGISPEGCYVSPRKFQVSPGISGFLFLMPLLLSTSLLAKIERTPPRPAGRAAGESKPPAPQESGFSLPCL